MFATDHLHLLIKSEDDLLYIEHFCYIYATYAIML